MKYFYIISLFLMYSFLNGCNQIEILNGTIGDKSHEFKFFPDSTFHYEYNNYCYSESSGKWEKKGNSIILNTPLQVDKIPLEYTKTENNNDSTVFVHIEVNSHEKPEEDYICWVIANGESRLFNPERGSYSFISEIPIRSIYFRVIKSPYFMRGTGTKMCYNDVYTETLNPDASLGESLHICVNIIDSLFGYTVFKDKELEIKHRRIIYHDDIKNKKVRLKKYTYNSNIL